MENFGIPKTEENIDERGQPETEVAQSIYYETRIPDKFIHPHRAEETNIHNIKVGDFEIPVSFEVEDGRFGITGIENKSSKGGIISGGLMLRILIQE